MQIETIRSGAPRPLANYNECFKVGPWVFAAGQVASDYKTGVAPKSGWRVSHGIRSRRIDLEAGAHVDDKALKNGIH